MKNISIFALSSLFLSVAAVPMNAKRDIVWVTETAEVVETIQVTKTVWVNAGETARARKGNRFSRTRARTWTSTVETTSLSTSTVYVAPSTSAPTLTVETTSLSTSTVDVAPSTSTPEVVPTTTSTTSTVYVAPTTSEVPSSTYVPPAPTTEAPAPTYAPPPTTTEAPSTTVAPSSTTTAQPVPTGTAPGTVYSGDITYYAVGLGSCGNVNTDAEPVVAMAAGMMDKPTMCGKSIKIRYYGRVHDAKVVDTCPGCAIGSLDLSPTLFTAVAPKGDGRVHGVEWWWA